MHGEMSIIRSGYQDCEYYTYTYIIVALLLPSNREYLALVDDVSLSSAASAQCLLYLAVSEEQISYHVKAVFLFLRSCC